MIGSGIRRLVKRRVVIHTKNGSSLRGVLTETFSDSLLLKAVEYLDEAKSTSVPGEALVLRSDVDWIQVKED